MATKLHKSHEGFQHIEDKIAKRQGISKKNAGAILAASTRDASKAAKAKNPNLAKVKGKSKGK